MQVTGRCHCGHVTFEAEVDPAHVGICHCTDCQRLTGSPFRVTANIPRQALRLTGGEPKVYRKPVGSERFRQQHFCPECGSPLFSIPEDDDAPTLGIRWGSIDQRAELKPSRQIWCRSAVNWLDDIASLPSHQEDTL